MRQRHQHLHHLLLIAALATSVLLASCGGNPAPPPVVQQPVRVRNYTDPRFPVDPPPRSQPGRDLTDPAPTDPPTMTTAEMLAARTAAHAQKMEAILNRKPVAAVTEKPLPPEPSVVQWMDQTNKPQPTDPPAPVARTIPMAEPRVAPVVRTVTDSTPSRPNQVASIGDISTGHAATNLPQDLSSIPRRTNAAAPVRSGPSLAALEPIVAQHVRDYPRDVWAHLDFQLMQFLRDEPVPQAETMTSLPTEDRELLTAVMDGLSNFRNALRADNNMLLSRKVRPLLDLGDRLRAQADLTVPTICLCTRVEGFGVYDPMDSSRFVAGKEHPALVYCEVENFSSQIDDRKMWQTKLSQEAVLYTEGGLPVWQDKAKTMTDLSRNRRHDFYVVKMIRLPANLTIGRYLLKVTIVDQLASRVAEATMPVMIVAQ